MPTKTSTKAKNKIHKVMSEFKEGKLKSGNSTTKVKSRKQAIAIALSEAREAGARIPKKIQIKKIKLNTKIPTSRSVF